MMLWSRPALRPVLYAIPWIHFSLSLPTVMVEGSPCKFSSYLMYSIIDLFGATAEYPATIVQDSTCTHIFKERDMCRNKLTQVVGYSAVKSHLFYPRCHGNL